MVISLEALFALAIGLFVFSSLFQDFSRAEFRLGIFLSIFAHVAVFFGAYFIFVGEQKNDARREFRNLSDEDLAKLNLQPETPDGQMSLGET